MAEGYRAIGFDIVHEPYHGDVPEGCSLALQDVLTLHGSQFKDAACIVASPPCQAYSYMAMPWKLAKAKAAAIRADESGEKMRELTALFDACFRIQREASEAAGRYIPMVVENVKGAQPWVGPAKAHFGSFYLWGDVESVGGRITVGRFGQTLRPAKSSKNASIGGGSWFAIGSPGQQNVSQNPDGRKVPGFNFHEYEKTGQPGRSFQSAAVDGVEAASAQGRRADVVGNGVRFTSLDCGMEGTKGMSGLRGFSHPSGTGGRDLGGPNDPRRFSSASSARKAASALIAEIPMDLARYIARCYHPGSVAREFTKEAATSRSGRYDNFSSLSPDPCLPLL